MSFTRLLISRMTIGSKYRGHGLGRVSLGLLACWRYMTTEYDEMTIMEATATQSRKFYIKLGFEMKLTGHGNAEKTLEEVGNVSRS